MVSSSCGAFFAAPHRPHHSAPNLTTSARRNLYPTYNRATEGDFRTRYFADKLAAFPPDAGRKPGQNFSFKV